VDDLRFGATVRRIRIRLGWRQSDLAARCGVSTSTISRIERGHINELTLATLRHVAAALEIRLDLVPRWRGGDLDRLLNARHSALHEQVARNLARRAGWIFQPEVSFAFFSERGVIDILAFHPARRALLVIELKTDIADVNELVGTIDRKARHALKIAAERGWAVGPDVTVSVWVIWPLAGRTDAESTLIRRCSERRSRSMAEPWAAGLRTRIGRSGASASGQIPALRPLGSVRCRFGGSPGPGKRPAERGDRDAEPDFKRAIVPNSPWATIWPDRPGAGGVRMRHRLRARRVPNASPGPHRSRTRATVVRQAAGRSRSRQARRLAGRQGAVVVGG
jgi:transcriptional regulator with XRE-family HTH domain